MINAVSQFLQMCRKIRRLGRKTREEIGKRNPMTALRFQTWERWHQTPLVSLRGDRERQRHTQRDRDSDRDSDRSSDSDTRETDRQTDRDRERHRERQSQRQTDRQRWALTETETVTQRHRQ